QNALISLKSILAVGGYRVSDGRPALYSGTAHDFFGSENARNRIDASFPSEVAPAHFGLLASGSRDGSSASYRGTSMATALCTRAVAEKLTNWDPEKPDPTLANNQWLIKAADRAESGHMNYKQIYPLKSGFGRLPLPPNNMNRHRFRDN
ncbi:MAG: S8 family serine peptidase, partial [Paracoccaceae bacterium]